MKTLKKLLQDYNIKYVNAGTHLMSKYYTYRFYKGSYNIKRRSDNYIILSTHHISMLKIMLLIIEVEENITEKETINVTSRTQKK